VWFKAGSQNDPPGMEGLSALTMAMLSDASTERNSYEELLDKMYPLAASYDARNTVEMSVLYGRVHKDKLEPYYQLFTDAVLHPAFKQEDLDRIKSYMKNYLENTLRYSSDEELGKAALYTDVFRGTPYGHHLLGSIESLNRITMQDIKDFYKKYYTRDNVVIALGGGYPADLVDRLKKDMEMLPAGAPPQVAAPQPAPIDGITVTIVEKNAASSAISMGVPIDLLRNNDDWYPLAIAASWLGEHRSPSSHLYQVIRESRGLNYGDYAYIEHYPEGGQREVPPENVGRRKQLFEIWIRPVPNPARQFALRAALREWKNLIDNGMTQENFNLTRQFLRKYILHYAPTTMQRLGYAIDDAFYGMAGSHLEKFRENMDKVTLDQVNAAIRKYWKYGPMHVVFVTNEAEKLKETLVSDAPSPITYQTPKPDAIVQEDKEIASFPLKIKPENVKIVQVDDLFVK
jgi:zinc protease